MNDAVGFNTSPKHKTQRFTSFTLEFVWMQTETTYLTHAQTGSFQTHPRMIAVNSPA